MGKNTILSILLCIASLSCSKPESPPTPSPPQLRMAVAYELNNLDPHHRSTLSSFSILSNFYETLVTSDAEMRIRPQLAIRWENPNSFTWVFHLHPAAKFSDGKLLTAEDVVFSFRRLLGNQSLEASSYLTGVVEVSAIDSHTVRVRTSEPSAIFLNRVQFVPIIRHGLSTQFLQKIVLGTGPYTVAEWKPSAIIRLRRNENYWGRRPQLQEAIYYL